MAKPTGKIAPLFLPLLGITLTAQITTQKFAFSAPLDEFLSVQQETRPFHGEVETGWDGMNKTVDMFDVRKNLSTSGGSSVGDYSGYHLRGGMAWEKHIWTDVSYGDHSVKTPYDNANNKFYQAAVQFKLLENEGKIPALALRLSKWGNSSGQAAKGSATPVFGTDISADSIVMKDPKDRQFQGDIIGSWAVSKTTTLSLFTGIGTSKVTVGDFFATLGGCTYKVTRGLQPDEVNGGMDSTIRGDAVNAGDPNCGVTTFSVPLSSYSLPELPEGMYVSYDAKYYQVGGMIQWQNDEWRLRLGYRLQKWDRGDLDGAIATLQQVDKTSYDTNQNISAEASYKLHPNIAAYARSQYMTNQFLGEVPYSYNLFSSHKFAKPYGYVSLGVAAGF
ncbi:MAG: hypothetical protein HQL73_02130 [Magnetococcales bacterium]|nr:hypothetical protein [Magnetococcales bacterium]